MELLERCMLKRENSIFKLRYAMATLKLHFYVHKAKNVSFH
jgi:hypothetical protein